MPTPSIYINLEDDVSKIVERIKRAKSEKVVLVCPKRCFLFNDSINLRLLKKQVDLLKKHVAILTMDERGQLYAKEAGFELKFLPAARRGGFSDIKSNKPAVVTRAQQAGIISEAVAEIKNISNKLLGRTESAGPKPIKAQIKVASPKISESQSTTRPRLAAKDIYFPPMADEQVRQRKRKAFNQKFITGLVAACLLLVVLLVFVVLPKATIAVYPKTEPVTRDIQIGLGSAVPAPNPDSLLMPASKISQTVEIHNSFQSQGKRQVGNKATGYVQIYNFTKLPINLKANTTKLTIGSQIYLLAQDVSGLKPTTYSNPYTKEVDMASLAAPVEVVAEGGGEEYNVPAGTRMEISNLVFGSKPQLLYAKTQTAVTGGTTRFLSLVSEQDLASAQSSLNDMAAQNVQDTIKQRGLILPPGSYNVQSVSFTTDKSVGTESPDFVGTLSATVTGLAVNSNDLQNLIIDRIKQTLASNQTLLISNNGLSSYKVTNLDLNNLTATLSIHFESLAELNVNLGSIASELTGKSLSQANDLLSSKAEIEKVDITLAPFWQRSLPFFAGKIKVYLSQPDNTASLGQ